jgi:hypothetical protein
VGGRRVERQSVKSAGPTNKIEPCLLYEKKHTQPLSPRQKPGSGRSLLPGTCQDLWRYTPRKRPEPSISDQFHHTMGILMRDTLFLYSRSVSGLGHTVCTSCNTLTRVPLIIGTFSFTASRTQAKAETGCEKKKITKRLLRNSNTYISSSSIISTWS